MQPFGTIKNPKISVPTKKQPPTHRYPVPYNITQPTVASSGGILPPKIAKNPFAEDTAKAFFDSETPIEFAAFENPQGRDSEPLQTPDDIRHSLRVQNKVNSLEGTPASLAKGPKYNENLLEDSNPPRGGQMKEPHTESSHTKQVVQGPHVSESEFLRKKISPDKRVVGIKDDDEYVRMASADEEEDEEPIVKNKERGLHSQQGRIEPHKRYQDEDGPNLNKTPNMSQFEDTSALLKLKRLELELAKEKKRSELFESEQMKLIHENTELKRRVEELNARADLAEKYDNREKLAKREEEAERLKLEVNRLTEENRILEDHSQKLLHANAAYRQESDVLIASQQAEKRRLQEEIQDLKRQLYERENPSNTLKQRNDILESQLVELREQVSLLTQQLTMKAHTNQKMNDFSEEIQSIVSTLSNVTIQTQTQAASIYSQHAQTSPLLFVPPKFPVASIDTQTHTAPLESQHAQTSPMIIPAQETTQVSPVKAQIRSPFQHQSPTKVEQKQSNPNSADKLHGAPVNVQVQNSPVREAVNILNTESPAKIHPHENLSYLQQGHTHEDVQAHPQEHNIYPGESQASPLRELAQPIEELEGPPKQVTDMPEHVSEVFHPVAQVHNQEEDPHMVKPPTINPPHHTQPPVEVQAAQPGFLDSFNTSESNDKVSGSGLMAPPKYKVPVRQIPKKAVPGFRPMTHQTNPFADEKSEPHHEQNIQFGISGSPEKTQESEIAQHFHQVVTEVPIVHTHEEVIESHPPQGVSHSVQHEEPPKIEQVVHHEPVREKEKVEEPPRDVLPPRTNAPPMGGFVPGRVPPRVVPGKAKLQKIGKNPFSSENESQEASAFTELNTQTQPVEHVPVYNPVHVSQEVAPTTHYESGLGIAPQGLGQSFAQDQGNTVAMAENFFDSLGKEPQQASETAYSQEISGSDLMKSFQTEGGLSASTTLENSRVPITKAVPVKKKRAAMPTNMFD